jgi:hypothetical protein
MLILYKNPTLDIIGVIKFYLIAHSVMYSSLSFLSLTIFIEQPRISVRKGNLSAQLQNFERPLH